MKTAQKEVHNIIHKIIELDNNFVYEKKWVRWGAVEMALYGVLERFKGRLEGAPQAEKEA